MRIIILSLSLISLCACNNRSANNKAQKPAGPTGIAPESDTAKLNARNLAGRDLAAGKGKYYFHGIALPSPAMVKAVKEKFGIELVGIGCEITRKESLYNNAVNAFVYQWYKVTVDGYLNSLQATSVH